MKDREPKYPMSLFVIGFVMNLVKNFFLLIPGVILLVIGIWSQTCLYIGLSLLIIDVIISLLEQIQLRNTVLNSDNPDFAKWQDAMLSPQWRENIAELTENEMEKKDGNDDEE